MSSTPINLVVLASGRGSNIHSIVNEINKGTCHAKVAAIITDQPHAPVIDFANLNNIPIQILPLHKNDDRNLWNDRIKEAIAQYQPDLIVLAGFMRILNSHIIQTFKHKIINIHPSLLPSFPGHDGPRQAIQAGVRISGCTVHLVDEGVDTGAILAQGAVPVLPTDNEVTLHKRIQAVEHALLPAVIHAIATKKISLNPVHVYTNLSIDEVLIVPSLFK